MTRIGYTPKDWIIKMLNDHPKGLNILELESKISDKYKENVSLVLDLIWLTENGYINSAKSSHYLTDEGKKWTSEKIEIPKKEKEKANFENDYKLKKWQASTFWWLFGFSILGFVFSLFSLLKSPSQNEDVVTKDDLSYYLDSIRSEIRSDIDDAQIQVLDEVYADTNIVNKK